MLCLRGVTRTTWEYQCSGLRGEVQEVSGEGPDGADTNPPPSPHAFMHSHTHSRKKQSEALTGCLLWSSLWLQCKWHFALDFDSTHWIVSELRTQHTLRFWSLFQGKTNLTTWQYKNLTKYSCNSNFTEVLHLMNPWLGKSTMSL